MRFRDFKLKNQNIRFKMMLYLMLFVLGIIITLWLFQTVFLEDFYETLRLKSIRDTAFQIESNIESPKIKDVLIELSYQDNICIHVLDNKGNQLFNTAQSRDCIIHKIGMPEINKLYHQSIDNGGSIVEKYERNSKVETDDSPTISHATKQFSFIYVKTIKKYEDNDRAILISTNISPIDATAKILKVQLLYSAFFFIIVAALLAWLISKKIANPIIKTNNDAKKLAEGDYSVRFNSEGYKEIIELRDTLNEAAIELGRAEELQGELIANISHDLRTPLTMITGYGEVMRDLPGENNPDNIQVIIDEANRLTRLVNDILDLSKIKSGMDSLEMKKINLTQIVKDNIDRCARLKEVEGYNLVFDYDEDIFVYADEIKISQVIYNLIGNALTFTGKDKKIIASQNIFDSKVRISIKDTGEGIPSEMIKDIWDRYYKVDQNHRRATVGTGLGLSIVKSIIEKHNGKCGVDSKINEGSTFWFELNI